MAQIRDIPGNPGRVATLYEHDQDFGDVEVTDHVNDKCKKHSL